MRRVVSRRRILHWLGGLWALLLPPAPAAARSDPLGRQAGRLGPRPAVLTAAEGGLFSDASGVRQIAQRYLALHPAEADREQLERRVESRLAGCGAHGFVEFRKDIAREVRADFAEGRIVVLDGWVVSVLEARLCVVCSAG